jgi:hypothetical protein
LDESDDDDNHHDDQDNVNQAANMKNGESEEPQDEQDYGNSPKHTPTIHFEPRSEQALCSPSEGQRDLIAA